jgi:alcohol dehydrogenase YqhD (iron-dependent ADH family)
MENFTAYNPTKLVFGKGCVAQLGKEAAQYGKKALVLIGKGSVKKNGILAAVEAQLAEAGIQHILVEGIKSNPVYQDADRAVAEAKAFGAEMIIAVGGGSVVDSAKAVAMGYYVEHSVWDFYTRQAPAPTRALPVLAVLTLAATGTEMNMFTVIQSDEAKQKHGFGHPSLYPKASFLDPEYTYSVAKDYTAFGVADLIAHTLEIYFDKSESPLSHHIASDIIKLALEYGRKVAQNPEDYEARANIMWLATTALNGSLNAGKKGGDWGVHAFEHTLSALYDIPHGAGLSIIYPAWMRHFYPEIAPKLDFLAERVLGAGKKGEDFINALEAFYKEIGAPVRLAEWGIAQDKHEEILHYLQQNKVKGAFFKMEAEDHQKLVALMA